MPPAPATAFAPALLGRRILADFRADRRLLLLVAVAVVIGLAGTVAARVLLALIALVTNLVWFGRLDLAARSLAEARPSPWMVCAPALGGLVIGLMARFGSEKIRGHGIPEAIEAILIGGSRMSPKVAVLKPISSAISIGTGGPFGAQGPIIMTGGAIGSLFAQCSHRSAAERKALPVAGAAAGMEKIARRGQHVTREYGIDPHEVTRVSEVMASPVETLAGDLPIPEAVAAVEAGRHAAYPVVDAAGRPIGLVTRADALAWRSQGEHAGERLGEHVSDAGLAVVHPGDVTDHAIDLMLAAGQGRLPVTEPGSGALVGLVTRKDPLQVRAAVGRAEADRQAYFAQGPFARRLREVPAAP